MAIESITAAVIAVSIIAAPSSYKEILDQNNKNIIASVIETQERKAAHVEKAIREAKKVEKELKDEQDLFLNLTVRPLERYSLSSGFGSRIHPITGKRKMHAGTDYADSHGSSIVTIRRGKVIEAGEVGGLGKRVTVQHANGVESLYAHMSDITVEVGDIVAAGVEIGKVGSTGTSTGPHLHLEIRIDGKLVNSEEWLKENLTNQDSETVNSSQKPN